MHSATCIGCSGRSQLRNTESWADSLLGGAPAMETSHLRDGTDRAGPVLELPECREVPGEDVVVALQRDLGVVGDTQPYVAAGSVDGDRVTGTEQACAVAVANSARCDH